MRNARAIHRTTQEGSHLAQHPACSAVTDCKTLSDVSKLGTVDPFRPLSDTFRVLLILPLLVICCALKGDDKSAFVLEGNFESVFAGKHHNAGVFSIRAYGPNALVDVVFENGYREITGTDSQDTFTYIPSTEPNTISNSGRAIISYGLFPTNAHFFEQVLGLVCARDPELHRKLAIYRFPFFGDYSSEEITTKIRTDATSPGLVESIQW
jgi:hypothetical protein